MDKDPVLYLQIATLIAVIWIIIDRFLTRSGFYRKKKEKEKKKETKNPYRNFNPAEDIPQIRQRKRRR